MIASTQEYYTKKTFHEPIISISTSPFPSSLTPLTPPPQKMSIKPGPQSECDVYMGSHSSVTYNGIQMLYNDYLFLSTFRLPCW